MKWTLRILTFFCIQVSALQAWPQLGEKFDFYSGARSLGMGDAAIAVVNDETSLVLNPAGLGKLRNFYGTIFDPELELSYNAYGFSSASPISAPTNIEGVKASLVQQPGSYYYAKGQIFPSFVARNFGIGLLVKQMLAATADEEGSLTAVQQDDMALLMGVNFRFFDGRIKLGVTGKVISRVEVNELALDPADDLTNAGLAETGQLREGVGVGYDVGLNLAAPWMMIPTLSIVARDLGGTTFDKSSGLRGPETDQRPLDLKQDVDVAVALFPIHNNYIRSAWTLEYRNVLTNQDDTNKTRYMHGGVEVNLADRFFLRAGYNQGYWTAGFESAHENFQFMLATYGEEVGVGDERKEDRRYVGKVGFRF